MSKCACGRDKNPKYSTCFYCSPVERCPGCKGFKPKKNKTCKACAPPPASVPSAKPVGNCIVCGNPLVAVGLSRKGGKDHKDWGSRKMHKKCWIA